MRIDTTNSWSEAEHERIYVCQGNRREVGRFAAMGDILHPAWTHTGRRAIWQVLGGAGERR